jgi:hypothetical protein
MAVNAFFLTIAENLNLHHEVRGDAISSLKEAFLRKFPGIKNIPTIETEIKIIVHSLKAKKRIRLLLNNKQTPICNHSLFTGVFPRL